MHVPRRSVRSALAMALTVALAGPLAVVTTTAATVSPAAAQAPAPYVSSVLPQVSPTAGGTAVRIYGSGFTGATAVTFGGVAAPSFHIVDDLLLTATTPPGADNTFVDIAVTTPGGTWTSGGFAPQLFYTNATVTVTPSTGLVSGQQVTVHVSGWLPNYGSAVPELTPLTGFLEGVGPCAEGPNPTCPPPWGPGPPPYVSPDSFPNTDATGSGTTSFNLNDPFVGSGYGRYYDPNIQCPVNQTTADYGIPGCQIVWSDYSTASVEHTISFASDPVPAAPVLSLGASTAAVGDTVSLSGVYWNANAWFGSAATPTDPGQTPLTVQLCTSALTTCTTAAADASVAITRYQTSSTNTTFPPPIATTFSGATLSGSLTVDDTSGCAPNCVVRVAQARYNYPTGGTTGTPIVATAPLTVGGPPTPGQLVPLSPSRVLDTRIGTGAPGPVAPGATVALSVTGHGAVPAAGVSAVVLNVTATQPQAGGYLTVWADGTPRPLASNLNFTAGETVPNLVVAPVGTDGKVDIYNGSGAGTVQVVADVSGYFTTGPPAAGGLAPLSPSRILDTRIGVGAPGPVAPGATVALPVDGQGGVPASGVGAVVLNVTATQPQAGGYLTVWPDGTPQPLASNLNFKPGETVPNLVVAPVGADGKIDIYNGSGAGTVQVVADVSGYFSY